ncbi:Protein GVQW3 [Anthophora plagiata]
MFLVYEVCKLSNETGNVVFNLATLGTRDLEERNGVLSAFASSLGTVQRTPLQNFSRPTETIFCQGAQIFRCFKAFSEGRESIQDEPRSGRSSSSRTDKNVDRIGDILRSDRRLIVRMIGEELNLTHTTVLVRF